MYSLIAYERAWMDKVVELICDGVEILKKNQFYIFIV